MREVPLYTYADAQLPVQRRERVAPLPWSDSKGENGSGIFLVASAFKGPKVSMGSSAPRLDTTRDLYPN